MTQEKKGTGILASGMAGAVIGAAAAAAAIVLSDEKNRKKAESILKDMQKQGNKVLKEITKRAMDLKEMGEKTLPEVKESKKLPNKKK